ncbi:MAG TPA: hypothetical protein VHR66_33005 [Gemmataceae bacterium]|jgi:hypothetical protein|nr:hypothetical protein [Gemmataceae bacterium]
MPAVANAPRTRKSAKKASPNYLAYCPPGRRHLPYAPPALGTERRQLLDQIRKLVLKLYPGTGRAHLTTEPFSNRFAAGTTHDRIIIDRAPEILPGSVGAIAKHVLEEIVQPKSAAVGYWKSRWSARTRLVRETRPKNTPQQRRWHWLIFIFKELTVWFAAFPADDLTREDLDNFVKSHDCRWTRNDYRRYMPAVRRLFREAGIQL